MPGRAEFVADPAIYTAAGGKEIEEGAGENPAPFCYAFVSGTPDWEDSGEGNFSEISLSWEESSSCVRDAS